jgi:hypothetical protein
MSTTFRHVPTPKQLEQIKRDFTYHAPKGDQVERYTALRDKFHECALEICKLTPEGRDQALALTQLKLSNMLANSAIACEGTG